jgi:hypothetical protein
MQFAKKLLMGAGAVVLVAVLLMVGAPKTVRAVVATLIRDVDNPGRAALVYASCFVHSSPHVAADLGCAPDYTVPATDRLVIQQVEARCQTPLGDSTADTLFTVTTNGNAVSHFLTLLSQGTDVFTGAPDFGTNQAVTYYADPGSTLRFDTIITDSAGFTSCSFQLNGYLISYP